MFKLLFCAGNRNFSFSVSLQKLHFQRVSNFCIDPNFQIQNNRNPCIIKLYTLLSNSHKLYENGYLNSEKGFVFSQIYNIKKKQMFYLFYLVAEIMLFFSKNVNFFKI